MIRPRSLVITALLLASPVSWSHHWVWALPMALALWQRHRVAALLWTVVFVARPMLWWFQTTYSGYRILAALTPAPFRRWPARRFWGMLYPLSYFLGMGYLVAIIGGLDWRNWLILLGISAVWWGFWGVFVWALVGFPAFWRRKSS